jgi:hypothetical protein
MASEPGAHSKGEQRQASKNKVTQAALKAPLFF